MEAFLEAVGSRHVQPDNHGGVKRGRSGKIVVMKETDVDTSKLLLWLGRVDPPSTCGKRRHANRPCAHTVSVDVSHRRWHGYGTVLLRSRQATAGASSIERPVPQALDRSYLSIPGPRCRGTHLRGSTGASGKCAVRYYSTVWLGGGRG